MQVPLRMSAVASSSQSGYIRLSPYGIRAGDQLVALHGAALASVLRKRESGRLGAGDQADSSEEDTKWMFVGEASVNGWMMGDSSRD